MNAVYGIAATCGTLRKNAAKKKAQQNLQIS
jgi:hypothetical protein